MNKTKKSALYTDVDVSTPLTPDTPVAVSTTAEVLILADPPQPGSTAQATLNGFLDDIKTSFFAPDQNDRLDRAWNGLQNMMRDREQTSEILQSTAQPGSYAKLLPAWQVVQENQGNITALLPAAAPLLPMAQMQQHAVWLGRIQKRSTGAQSYADSYSALESQIAQKLYRPMYSFFQVTEATLAAHRSLQPVHKALDDLFNGSAQQGVDTRKHTERAVSEALAQQSAATGANKDAAASTGTTVTTTATTPVVSPGTQTTTAAPATGKAKKMKTTSGRRG